MVTILIGDCRELLKTLPDASVNCCVTSPPYWGLRDYGTGIWQGGDAKCEHVVGEMRRGMGLRDSPANTRGGAIKCAQVEDIKAREQCPKCGAVRSDQQIGLEGTVDEYLAKMVEVFREVRRVLRNDGTCWLNLGDSYNAYNGNRGTESSYAGDRVAMEPKFPSGHGLQARALKQKDLIGIPWRVAFALQAEGWYLRQDIIWHKPNPMPESVTDRCTKAHEYIFLLTKSVRYYYDAEAIKEPVSGGTHPRSAAAGEYPGNTQRDENRRRMKTPDGWDTSKGAGGHGSFHKNGREKGRKPKSCWNGSSFDGSRDLVIRPNTGRKLAKAGSGIKNNDSFDTAMAVMPETRNKRSVWTISTQSFKEAHFATFPEKLVVPCILAGCPEGGTVLDPFAGSGTVGEVGERLGRNSILIELKPEYCKMAKQRTAQGGLFCGVAPDNQCGE